jgi:hypothetical protein
MLLPSTSAACDERLLSSFHFSLRSRYIWREKCIPCRLFTQNLSTPIKSHLITYLVSLRDLQSLSEARHPYFLQVSFHIIKTDCSHVTCHVATPMDYFQYSYKLFACSFSLANNDLQRQNMILLYWRAKGIRWPNFLGWPACTKGVTSRQLEDYTPALNQSEDLHVRIRKINLLHKALKRYNWLQRALMVQK